MNDQLERELRHHFDDRTSHLPASGPGVPEAGTIRLETIASEPRRSPWMFAAAASIVALAVGGLFVVAGRSGNDDTAMSDGGPIAPGETLEPAATLPDTGDVSSAPVTVAAAEPVDWYRLAPDLDVAWFQDPASDSPSMFCWRTPAVPEGTCTADAIGALVVPLVVPGGGNQTLVLAGGDRTEPTVQVTLDDGSMLSAPQNFDDTIDWGVARFELALGRSITLVNGKEVATHVEPAEVAVDDADPAGAGSLVFSPTTGSEPALFDFEVSGRGTPTATIDTVTPETVCISVDLGNGTASPCVDAQTVSTGLAYNLFGNPGGGFTVIGVVPDMVDTVEVGGVSVPIVDNVWELQLESDAPAELRVGDSRTGEFNVLPGAAPNPTPPSTTLVSD